jgi:simple sugar transport system permease protein
MAVCDVCQAGIAEKDSQRVSAAEFRQMVDNGFNPIAENILISSEITDQAKDLQYQNWKARVLTSNTERILCHRCYDLAKHYSPKRVTEGAEIAEVHTTYHKVQRTVAAPFSKMSKIRAFKLEISITVVLVAVLLLYVIGNPTVFTRYDIYYSFMSTIPFCGIMALSMTLVVVLGEMDLSFPSVLAFSAWMFGWVFEQTGNIWIAMVVCFAIGILAGALNAFMTVKVGIPSLVVTIGTQFFFRGLVNVVAEGKGIALVKAKGTIFYALCVGRIPLGKYLIPAQAIWFAVLGVGFWFLLNRHRFGSHVLFVGDNKESARMMGINVNWVKSLVFVQMGFFAAFAGILSTLEVTYFWPSQGAGYLLPTLASVFIGGTSVFGGMGTIYGTFVGALIIGSLEAGIVAAGLTGFWTQVIYGLIIMVSVSIYAVLQKKRG